MWYKSAHNFKLRFAAVQTTDNSWNFIDTKGKLLSEEWFEEVTDFGYNVYIDGRYFAGYAGVKMKNDPAWYKINMNGNISNIR